jgi:PAS domain S-box-containing protein
MSNPVHILVVDDEPDILDGTARLLERAGYGVARAATGEEALQAVRERPPDLLLLDRDLPDMDGLEVCRWIKRDPPLVEAFVILISGSYTESEQQAEGLEAGADGYIARPLANRELLARIEAYVRILHLTRSLRQQTEELKRINDAASQAQLAALNLMEDAVAARDRAEQNRQLLNSIINSTPSSIFAFDLQHRFSLLNEAMARFYGMTIDEVLGKTLHDVFPKDLADTLRATNSQIMATGEPVFLEEVVVSRVGNTPRLQLTSKFALCDTQGRINGLGGGGYRHHRAQAGAGGARPAGDGGRAGRGDDRDHGSQRHDSLCQPGV